MSTLLKKGLEEDEEEKGQISPTSIPFRSQTKSGMNEIVLNLPHEIIGQNGIHYLALEKVTANIEDQIRTVVRKHQGPKQEKREGVGAQERDTSILKSDFTLVGEIPTEGLVFSSAVPKSPLREVVHNINSLVGNFCQNEVFFNSTILFFDYIVSEDSLFESLEHLTTQEWIDYLMLGNFDFFFEVPSGVSIELYKARIRKNIKKRQSYVGDLAPGINIVDIPNAITQESLKFRLHLKRGFFLTCSSTILRRLGFIDPALFGTAKGQRIRIENPGLDSNQDPYLTITADRAPEALTRLISQDFQIDLGILKRKINITKSVELPLALLHDKNFVYQTLKSKVFNKISQEIDCSVGFYTVAGSTLFTWYSLTMLDSIALIKDSSDNTQALVKYPSGLTISNPLLAALIAPALASGSESLTLAPGSLYGSNTIYPSNQALKKLIENYYYNLNLATNSEETGELQTSITNESVKHFYGQVYGISHNSFSTFAPGDVLFTLLPNWTQDKKEQHLFGLGKILALHPKNPTLVIDLYYKSVDDQFKKLELPVQITVQGLMTFYRALR